MKMYTFTLIFALLFWTALSLGGTSESEALNDVVFAVLMMLTFWTILYCAFVRKRSPSLPVLHLRRRFAFAAAIVAIAVVGGLSTQELEAAIVNRRLRKYGTSGLSPSDIEAIVNALEYTQKNALPVNPAVVSMIGRKLSTPSGTPGAESQSVHAALESVANTQSLIRAPRGTTVPSTAAPTPGVAFTNSFFANVTVKLDGLYLENCEFTDCPILYNGGPLRLVRCLFNRCQFQISNVPNGHRLLSELSESNIATLVVQS